MARIMRESGVNKVQLRQARKEDGPKYWLENDPRFLRRIEQARDSLRAGRGVHLEYAETE